MTFGSLFSGCGGMDLGLERAGLTCAFQVEIDEFCRKVLAKHWPDVPKYGDIREVTGEQLGFVDVLAGGFPCQDISSANSKGKGIEGQQSGLWAHFHRLISEIRPGIALVENSPNLLKRGMGRVLGDLAGIRYDAEWFCLSACAVGAPHTRERLFIVAHPQSVGGKRGRFLRHGLKSDESRGAGKWNSPSTGIERSIQAEDWQAFGDLFCALDDGFPKKVDCFRALGNAVVPQVAEYIGRRLIRESA